MSFRSTGAPVVVNVAFGILSFAASDLIGGRSLALDRLVAVDADDHLRVGVVEDEAA